MTKMTETELEKLIRKIPSRVTPLYPSYEKGMMILSFSTSLGITPIKEHISSKLEKAFEETIASMKSEEKLACIENHFHQRADYICQQVGWRKHFEEIYLLNISEIPHYLERDCFTIFSKDEHTLFLSTFKKRKSAVMKYDPQSICKLARKSCSIFEFKYKRAEERLKELFNHGIKSNEKEFYRIVYGLNELK